MAEEPRQGLLGACRRQPVMAALLIVRCHQISRQRLCCQQQAGAGNGVVHKGHQAGGWGEPRDCPGPIFGDSASAPAIRAIWWGRTGLRKLPGGTTALAGSGEDEWLRIVRCSIRSTWWSGT